MFSFSVSSLIEIVEHTSLGYKMQTRAGATDLTVASSIPQRKRKNSTAIVALCGGRTIPEPIAPD